MSRPSERQPSSDKDKKSVLRQLRERAGLTREELITRLGNRVSLATLARWETKPSEPSMTRQEWADFCEAIGIRFEDLPKNLSAWVSSDTNGIK